MRRQWMSPADLPRLARPLLWSWITFDDPFHTFQMPLRLVDGDLDQKFSRSDIFVVWILDKKNAQSVDVPGSFASTRTVAPWSCSCWITFDDPLHTFHIPLWLVDDDEKYVTYVILQRNTTFKIKWRIMDCFSLKCYILIVEWVIKTIIYC